MRQLVALDLPGGAQFLEQLLAVFDAGDAAFPLDQRLAPAERRRLVEKMAPSRVVDPSGTSALEGGRPVEHGDAVVVATSGTTGEPKGVVLTHDALLASARASSDRLSVEPASDRWLCCLPVAHIGGLSVLTRALLTGTGLEVHDGFAPGAVTEALARGANLVSLVPTALRRLGGSLPAAKAILLGGSAPGEERPGNAVVTYGMTETGSGVVYDGVPLEGVEVRLGAGDEIELRAPMLLRAYRDGTDPRRHGWLPTGDAGRIGPDGRLEVTGRLKECIVSGGEKIWPERVEAVLARHPGVAEAAVGGVADPEWGERLVAYVVPSALGAPTLEELRAAVRDELGAVYAPKDLLLVEGLPRTGIGKLKRSALPGLSGQRR